MFLSYFYSPLINKHTRIDTKRGTSTLIDNIYTNVGQLTNNIKSGLFKTSCSDHYPIFCITDLMIKKQSSKYITRREFNNKNISTFNKSLKKISWDTILSDTFQNSFSSFQNTFCHSFLHSFPMKTIKIGYNNRLPFMTKGLRSSIKHKHALKHIYDRNPTEENKLKCKIFNNKLTSILRIKEREYYEEQLDLSKADIGKSWKLIKEIIGKNKILNNNTYNCTVNGKLSSNQLDICNAFNTYFVQVGSKLAENIKNTSDPLKCLTNTLNNICIPYITEYEI